MISQQRLLRQTYSLWRGSVLLGRLHPDLSDENPTVLYSIFEPTDAFLPGKEELQTTELDWPGMPVFQAPDRLPFTSGLGTVLGETYDGVPADDLLILRTFDNHFVSTRMIAIKAIHRADLKMRRVCLDAGIAFSGWYVLIALEG